MAVNPATSYGTDVRCVIDADAFFTAATGLDILRQDLIHRLTTDDVLGPGGVAWGRDIRRLLGAPARDLPALQAVFEEVLQRDPRVQRATVTLTATTRTGLADVRFEAVCVTALGPFDLILSVLDLTNGTITGQGI